MTILSVIGAVVVGLLVLVVIGAVLEFFFFGPRRERLFKQNYRSTSADPTGPFWWFPGTPVKRPHPVPAPEEEQHERMRRLQFVLLLALIAIGYLIYRLAA